MDRNGTGLTYVLDGDTVVPLKGDMIINAANVTAVSDINRIIEKSISARNSLSERSNIPIKPRNLVTIQPKSTGNLVNIQPKSTGNSGNFMLTQKEREMIAANSAPSKFTPDGRRFINPQSNLLKIQKQKKRKFRSSESESSGSDDDFVSSELKVGFYSLRTV